MGSGLRIGGRFWLFSWKAVQDCVVTRQKNKIKNRFNFETAFEFWQQSLTCCQKLLILPVSEKHQQSQTEPDHFIRYIPLKLQHKLFKEEWKHTKSDSLSMNKQITRIYRAIRTSVQVISYVARTRENDARILVVSVRVSVPIFVQYRWLQCKYWKMHVFRTRVVS